MTGCQRSDTDSVTDRGTAMEAMTARVWQV